MDEQNIYIGIDVGSTTCKIVVIDDENSVIQKKYEKIYSRPIEVTLNILKEMDLNKYAIKNIGVTGSSRNAIAKILDAKHVKNEITSQIIGSNHLFPSANTIIQSLK